jgi:hypothetical protein
MAVSLVTPPPLPSLQARELCLARASTGTEQHTSKLPAQQRLQIPRLRRPKALLAKQGLLERDARALDDADEEGQDALGAGGGEGGGDVVDAEGVAGAELGGGEAVVLGGEEGICLLCVSGSLGVLEFAVWGRAWTERSFERRREGGSGDGLTRAVWMRWKR